jgi:hypothetical protein
MIALSIVRPSRRPRPTLLVAAIAALLAIVLSAGVALADQKYVLTTASAQQQTAQVGTLFPEPPEVRVCQVGSNPCIGVGGVQVTFTAPASGASGKFATTNTNTVTITSSSDSSTLGMVSAPAFRANTIAGSYTMRVVANEPFCPNPELHGNDPQWCAVPTAFSFTNSTNPPTGASLISQGNGSNQAAQINHTFATDLSIAVFDGSNQLLPGITVTFTAPSSGAGGTFANTGTRTTTAVTGPTGLATAAPFTANGISGGPYTVTATISGNQTNTGLPLSNSFALYNTLNNPIGVPNIVSVAAGSGQQVPVSTVFPTNLQVVVLDGSLNYVPGADVVFNAPTSGPGGSFAGGAKSFKTTSGPTGLATASQFTSNTTAGSFAVTVTATKSGASASTSIGLTNGRVETTTTVSGAPAGGAVFGQQVTISATVKPVEGTQILTAPVTFKRGGTNITGCVNVTPVAGVATCAQNGLAPGTYSYTASYPGDTVSQPSASAAVSYTIRKADTGVTITTHAPNPSLVGRQVTVKYQVGAVAPGAGTPTGNVTVKAGTDSCVGTVAAGQCTLTFSSAGAKSLTAAYAGDGNFNAKTSAAATHTVNKIDTTTTIIADGADPSSINQAVTVQFGVVSNVPGAGTPTGNVTVSDGTNSCTASVAVGRCDLTFATAGNWLLVATYAGDGTFNGSASVSAPHAVGLLPTLTTLAPGNPSTSVVGQTVPIQYSVVPASGAGAPTGDVTVSDGVASCTGTVAEGTCTITFTMTGARTLTATYAGDATFASGTSPGVQHQVDGSPSPSQSPSPSATPSPSASASPSASPSPAASPNPAPSTIPCGQRFGDVPADNPACAAIEGLAAQGVIRGCDQESTPPLFCPGEPTLRAQMAVMIVRAMGWSGETSANPFTDKCDPLNPANCVDDELWNAVGILAAKGVAKGYTDAATCAPAAAPCYAPRENVLYAQVISFVTRAMVKQGYWTAVTTDSPAIYPNIPANSGHRLDFVTFVANVGPVPGTASATQDFALWDRPSTRAWFAQTLWLAIQGH